MAFWSIQNYTIVMGKETGRERVQEKGKAKGLAHYLIDPHKWLTTIMFRLERSSPLL